MSDLARLLAEATLDTAATGEETATAGQLTVPYSQIPAIATEWLWPGVIPLGSPVMLAAPGGTGKGLAVAAITAIVTRGEPFPGEPQGREPASVILIAPEDDANEDLAYRLRAAGADLSLVHDLTLLADGSPFLLPRNLPTLREAIAEVSENGPPVTLVALDPLLALCERGIGSASAARAITGPLQEIARESGVALIVTHHTVKTGEIAGSKSLTDAFRTVWRIGRESDGARLMTIAKTNRAAAPVVRYRIEGEGSSARAAFSAPRDAATLRQDRAARLRLVTDELARRRRLACERGLAEARDREPERAATGPETARRERSPGPAARGDEIAIHPEPEPAAREDETATPQQPATPLPQPVITTTMQESTAMTDRTTSKQLWIHSGIDGLVTVGIWTSHDQDSAQFTLRPDEREALMKALQITGPQHVVVGGYGISVTRQYDTPPVNGVRTGPVRQAT